jgi:CheY-like chemotaxis protein/PAS domain-containing protein
MSDPQQFASPLAAPSLSASSSATGEMRELLRKTDWSRTALGPMDGWPESLRIAVDICLSSRFPMFLWWGESLINIYNDAYIPVLGKRHPAAFAQPAQQYWHEIWDVLSHDVEAVMVRGEATWNERVLLVMERNGFAENTWFTWSYSPLRDSHGKICGLFCACSEETERVKAEHERDRLIREAQEAARNLRNWFDHAPGFVALLRGRDFVFEMVNQAYYQLVGHRPIEGLPAFEALPEVKEQGFQELLERVYDTGEPFVGRALPLSVQKEPGGPVTQGFIDLLYQPVRDADGRVVGIFAQGHDVSEQVRAVEGLKEADRRKDEFLATLAHELRNPLAPIRQAANLAKNAGLDPARQAWALEVIERQSGHMAVLLDDLLDVSRISRGKLDLRLQPVVLRDVVTAATEAAAPLVERKRHALHVELPPEPVQLQADPIRLTQVLQNLLSNAAKYTDPGGSIHLSARQLGGELRILVRDNGIGLSATGAAQVFGMFSQELSAIDRAEGGLGIGLALSKGIVELHGGTIAARSPGPGQGSEFEIRLPWRAPEPSSTDEAATPPAVASVGRTVLLADDNQDALETLTLLLQAYDHTVYTASNGDDALALAERHRPEVVVLDIGMPGLNGYAAAQAIRQTAWGQRMLLVALTGWGQAEDQARAEAAGFDRHFTKPVMVEELQALLAQTSSGSR